MPFKTLFPAYEKCNYWLQLVTSTTEKPTLIKALTGKDTDRLKEEKLRGMTTDLGFAYLDLPSGIRAGIIDVSRS